jgi:diacylglycerol kinase (ATP)
MTAIVRPQQSVILFLSKAFMSLAKPVIGSRQGDVHIKITLIHNPSAGDNSQPNGEEIVDLIRAAGHKVNYQSCKEKKWKKALKKPCDMVAVAGGDGTVGKVATRLLASRTPIAVLPMGTANNIAKTLGIASRTLPELIKGWSKARCVNFDAGVAEGPWGSVPFIEGFGIGLFAETMSQLQEKKNTDLAPSGKPTSVMNSVLRVMKERLQNYQAVKMTVRLDGDDLSGDYLMLEALNIGRVGPNLKLAPNADIHDGFLDVVLVPKRERSRLSGYFAELIKGNGAHPNLTIRRGQHLQIEWESSPVHIDDTAWPEDDGEIPVRLNAIHVNVQPAALVFLIPKQTRPTRKTAVKD